MRRTLCFAVVMFCLVVAAQQPESTTVTVRGHNLGENVAVFAERFGCAHLLSMSAKEAKRSRSTDDVAACRMLSSNAAGRLAVRKAATAPYNGYEATFNNGNLASITVDSPIFQTALDDVSERYGKPLKMWAEKRSNAYGAIFELHSATWTLPGGISIVALEGFSADDPGRPATEITFFAPGEMARIAAEQPKRPNGLD